MNWQIFPLILSITNQQLVNFNLSKERHYISLSRENSAMI